jgi:hypothetical protein
MQPAQPTPQVQQTPPIAPEIQNELTTLMQNLILKANELSFEYSTLECDEITNCPLAKKSKELFKELKKLTEFVKKMAQPQAGYVR